MPNSHNLFIPQKEVQNMRLRYFLNFGLLILYLSLTVVGCATSPDSKKEKVPKWMKSIPVNDKYFYAVGISGKTRKVQDAWNQAIHRARAELGKTIITHVTSQNLIISTTRGEYSSQIIDALSDTELNFTEVIERWFDRNGSYGPPNHYYVLVRLAKKRAEMILKGLK